MKGIGTTIVSDIPSSQMFSLCQPTRTIVESGGSTSTSTIQDSVFDVTVDATVWTWSDIKAMIPLGEHPTGSCTYTSSNPSVATIDQDGVLTPVTPGNTIITVCVAGLGVRKATVGVVPTGGANHSSFQNYISGSLGAAMQSEINTLIAGKTPEVIAQPNSWAPHSAYPWDSNWNLYTTDPVSGSWTQARNTGWWGDIDVTCISRCYFNGVAITKRDIVFARHFGFGPTPLETPIGFYDNDSNLILRYASQFGYMTNPDGDGSDIMIVTLSEDLPDSITPAKVMPANFRNYLPNAIGGYPMVFTNQDETLLIGDLYAGNPQIQTYIQFSQSTDARRSLFYYSTRVLDSGSPIFHLINGELVMLAHLHYINAGPVVADNLNQIQTAINQNAAAMTVSPYSIQTADLSGFTSF